MSDQNVKRSKSKIAALQSSETSEIMAEVDSRFNMLEESLEDFKQEIRDTYLAMEISMESLKNKIAEIQSELVDWQDEVVPGNVSKH